MALRAGRRRAGLRGEARIPLDRFEATSFGRLLRNAGPVDPKEVNALGFLLGDKKGRTVHVGGRVDQGRAGQGNRMTDEDIDSPISSSRRSSVKKCWTNQMTPTITSVAARCTRSMNSLTGCVLSEG